MLARLLARLAEAHVSTPHAHVRSIDVVMKSTRACVVTSKALVYVVARGEGQKAEVFGARCAAHAVSSYRTLRTHRSSIHTHQRDTPAQRR